MSAAHALIDELRDLGVALRVVGDRLHYRPKSAVTPELRERMAACKPELIALLERLEERAAIIEHDAGLPRAEAERQARLFADPTGVRDPENSASVGKRP